MHWLAASGTYEEQRTRQHHHARGLHAHTVIGLWKRLLVDASGQATDGVQASGTVVRMAPTGTTTTTCTASGGVVAIRPHERRQQLRRVLWDVVWWHADEVSQHLYRKPAQLGIDGWLLLLLL